MGGESEFGILLDLGLLIAMAAVLIFVGGHLYPRVGR